MKLITKTNLNFLVVLAIVLPISCIALFFSLKYFMHDEMDELLEMDEMRIVEQLKENATPISIAPVIEVIKIEREINIDEAIKDVLVYDPIGEGEEPYRELASVKKIKDQWYLIKVRHSTIENADFFKAISLTMGSILILIFILLFFLNYKLSVKLWKPFYYNIDQLKAYSFKENKEIELLDSKINEFKDFKKSLITLTQKLQNDYLLLKEFTENASHEIQTPLSIISMNLDELLQEEHTEGNYKKLYGCYQTVQRLSKLNEKLLFLAKLDNHQFNDFKEINLNDLFALKVAELNPLLEERNLEIKVEQKQKFIASMDPVLANILLINLLSNAIKHAVAHSIIEVSIDKKSLTIYNKSNSIIDNQLIFQRFKKGNGAENSTGLGLSIVKSIAELSNLEVEASYNDEIFTISISVVN